MKETPRTTTRIEGATFSRDVGSWISSVFYRPEVQSDSREDQVPKIALTFDDPTADGGANLTWHEVNERILAALASNSIKSISLFAVCGSIATVDNNCSPPEITLDTLSVITPRGLDGIPRHFSSAYLERAQFYQSLARRVLMRSVRHTVLLHHSALNGLFVGDLIAMFRRKGWRPVDADYAYRDPVYDLQPKILPMEKA